MRQVLDGLPARGDPRQDLLAGAGRKGAGHLPIYQGQMEGHGAAAFHAADCARGLHRLRGLHRYLPGKEQERRQPEGHQHGAPGAVARDRAGELGVLPRTARGGSLQAVAQPGEGPATAAAALRVLRRLRGLRRDGLRQAADAVVRRPAVHRQRHRLLVDLRWQPAHHALHLEPRGARSDLGQLAV